MKALALDTLAASFWPTYWTSLVLLAVFALTALTPGCAVLDDDSPSAEVLVYPGDPFNLREGQTARLRGSNFSVTFVKRTAESRCPQGVQCFWEGEAEIELITRSGETLADTFRVRGFFDQAEQNRLEAIRFGYRMEFERLDPYPIYDVPDPAPVRLALRIERLS